MYLLSSADEKIGRETRARVCRANKSTGSFVSRQGRTLVRKGIKIDIDSRRENEINLSGCLTNAFLNEVTPTLTDRPRDQCCRRN